MHSSSSAAHVLPHPSQGSLEWTLLAGSGGRRRVARRSFVYLPGDDAREVFLLETGRVKLTRVSSEGRELILALIEPGELFGPLTGSDSHHQELAEAMQGSQLCAVPRAQFERLLHRFPSLAARVAEICERRRHGVEQRLTQLAFADVPTRLASLLLDLAERYGRSASDGVLIDLRLSQQELAALIGSTRETTSTTLNVFKREGLLGVRSRLLVLRQPEALRKRAAATTH